MFETPSTKTLYYITFSCFITAIQVLHDSVNEKSSDQLLTMVSLKMLVLQLFQFICIYSYFVNSDYVPVVMLTSPSGNLPSRSVSAVHKISTKEFQDDYLKKLKGQGPLIVFYQDTLSLEDFGQYGNIYGSQEQKSAFKHLEELIEKYPSLYIPAVETLKGGALYHSNDWEIKEVSAETLDQLNTLNVSDDTMIVVKLPSTVTTSDRREAIERNDDVIGKALNHLQHLDKFSVVYTGQQPSWTTGQDHIRISRHILEDMDTNSSIPGIFFYNNYTLFHSLNVTYLVKSDKTELVSLLTVSKADAFMVNKSIMFSLAGKGVDVTSFNMSFEFKISGSSWHVYSLKIDVESSVAGAGGKETLDASSIWAPLGMSFGCQKLGKLLNKNKTVAVSFELLQIQPVFSYTGNKFGDSFDCVGFFTISIWMSIFITIILVLILAFGISMLMDINTNDRFDDPKGKTIQVPAVD